MGGDARRARRRPERRPERRRRSGGRRRRGGAGGGADGTGVGLDKFLARHTSEDNASFAVEHAKDRVEHKRKYWWAFDAPGGDAPRLTAAPAQPRLEGGAAAQPNDAARLKALGLRTDAVVEVRAEAGSADAAPARRADGALVCAPAASGGGGGASASSSSSTGALALAPSLAPARPYHKQGAIDRDERPSRLDYHHFSHHNALMFPPKAHPVQHPLTGPPAAMEHANTRFPAAAAAANEAAEAAAAGGGAAVGGAAAGAVEPGRAPPDLRGYSLVSAMPSPMPGAAGESPVMTWGAVVGTPQRLGDDFGGGTSAFAMAPPPPREQKANRLAADAARSLRARKGGGTPGGGGGVHAGRAVGGGPAARSLARADAGRRGGLDGLPAPRLVRCERRRRRRVVARHAAGDSEGDAAGDADGDDAGGRERDAARQPRCDAERGGAWSAAPRRRHRRAARSVRLLGQDVLGMACVCAS